MDAVWSTAARRRVLAWVRAVVGAEFTGADSPAAPAELPMLERDGASFVSLCDAAGGLRGCIGTLEAFEPLGENLRRNALAAAFGDPRFEPLEPEEFAEVRFEVSVPEAPHRIGGIGEWAVGRDGIVLVCGVHRALFLPQVAAEQGWDAETALGFLARKAGLPPDGWRRPETELAVFGAQVFGE